MKTIWGWARIEITTCGSAIRLATDCAAGPVTLDKHTRVIFKTQHLFMVDSYSLLHLGL